MLIALVTADQEDLVPPAQGAACPLAQVVACQQVLAAACPRDRGEECLPGQGAGCHLAPEVDVHMVLAAVCRLDLEVECPRALEADYQQAQAVVVAPGQEPEEIAGIAPIQIARQQLIELNRPVF